MPEHIRFILRHAAVGFILAVAFVALLLGFNVANLWHLVTHTSEGPIALVMLVVFCTITFGSAQIGYRIMTLGSEDEDGGDSGRRDGVFLAEPQLRPIPVERDRVPPR